MTKIFYLLASVLIYPLALAYETYCRYHDLSARHAVERPPVIRHTGRHTAAYVRRHGYTLRVGTQPEAANG